MLPCYTIGEILAAIALVALVLGMTYVIGRMWFDARDVSVVTCPRIASYKTTPYVSGKPTVNQPSIVSNRATNPLDEKPDNMRSRHTYQIGPHPVGRLSDDEQV